MHRKVLFVFFFLFVFCVSACKMQKDFVQQEETSGQESWQINDEDEYSGEGLNKPISNKIIELTQGEKLEELIKAGEDNAFYCNLEENLTRVFMRAPEEYPVLVCNDPVYDITYYINYGRDYFIYAKHGDKEECVVKIPARDLYCREGVLYFRTENYDIYEFDSFENGAVLAYYPINGSVEKVIDFPVYDMGVYPDGIMYAVQKFDMEEDGTASKSFQLIRHFYSFETEEDKELGATLHTMARWKDYQLVMEFVKDGDKTNTVYHLENMDGISIGELPNLINVLEPYRTKTNKLCFFEGYHILGDSIYYIVQETESLMRYDMVTGKEETVVKLALPSLYTRNFIIHDETIYFSNGIRYSVAEDKQYKTEFGEKSKGRIQSFYTDGEELYILVDGVLWLYEERKKSDYGTVVSQIAGRSATAGCYEAVLHPLGE